MRHYNMIQEKERSDLVLHAELALPLRTSAQLIRVSKHIVQSNLRNYREFIVADLAVNNGASSGVQTANNRTYTKDISKRIT